MAPLCSEKEQLKTPRPALSDEVSGLPIPLDERFVFPDTKDSRISGPSAMKRTPGHIRWHRVLHTEPGLEKAALAGR